MSSVLAGRLRPSIAALSRRAVPKPLQFVPTRNVPSLLAVRSMATSFKKDFQEFIFIIPDKPDSLEKRKQVRPSHFENFQPMRAAGKVVIGGATLGSHPTGDEFPDMNGSMMIYRVKNLEEAYELCRADPYAVEGVWDVDNAKVIPVRTSLASMGK